MTLPACKFPGTRLAGMTLALLATLLSLVVCGSAQSANSVNYLIPNNTPGFIKNAQDTGPVDPNTIISVTVWLQLQHENQLDQLVAQVHQKGSPNYHKWITQNQFNAQFGPTAQELNAVQNYLSAKNLTVLAVAENNMYVKVEGTVGQIEKTFHVQIDNFNLNGTNHRANTGNPSINSVAGAHVAAITGMDDYEYTPMIAHVTDENGNATAPMLISGSPQGVFFSGQCFRAVETHTFTSTGATATYTGNRYGADITNTGAGALPPCGYSPQELRTAYNMEDLYKVGLDGSGQTVVIVDAYGSATIQNEAQVFSEVYGLPAITASNFQVLRAPGASNHPPTRRLSGAAAWAAEISLDVEWVHAMAPGANIVLVVGPNNGSDLDEAINYAVVHHLGNVISNSWGSVEGFGNPAGYIRINRILEMAAVQGIDVNFSSGDDGDFSTVLPLKTVSFPASSPFATGIGGTSLFLKPDNTIDFQTGWGTNLTRIVEANQAPVVPPLHLGFQFGAGGGPSLTFAKPAFQAGLPGTTRQVPDIAWLADPYTGAEFVYTTPSGLGLNVIGGTSLACPMFSALMAIASQKAGMPLGQAAQLVYSLPAGSVQDIVPPSPANNVKGTITTTAGTINESASGLVSPLGNSSPFLSAFYNGTSGRWYDITFETDTSLFTGPGWDNVTGVGTPNGAAFVDGVYSLVQ